MHDNNLYRYITMISSATWRQLDNMHANGFLKDDQNCTNPKDECNLKYLKNLINNAHA